MSATPALEDPADDVDAQEMTAIPAQLQEPNNEQQQTAVLPPAASPAHGAAERVRQSKLLPPALKERLALLVEASGGTAQDAQAAAPLEEALRAVEEALPDFLLAGRPRADKPEHPGGDSFFSGDPRELSDAEAEKIARDQLVRSGLLRGQRVRVAD